MGRKTKVGKQRKDKFYQLAKETGYRSRAAFKLIQLNRKFEFLQRSQVLIDLCAAPGGWMQVAKQNMPVSSVVIGVDLFPIKSIPGCVSIIGDITTNKCRSDISKELQTWKADAILHDGAPNVGQNWIHDAYQQACLTLSALKLATNFLKQGGWFVTKVFRSKDYNPLLWVFKQLFKKVHATKPQASRNESAEIFVVCQYYIAPAKLDGRFLDPRFVFKELDMEPSERLNLLHPDKQKKSKAEGYSDLRGVYHSVPVSEFITSEDPLSVLQIASSIKFDDDNVANHQTTTNEIKECCKDIKVLGRKDIKSVLAWAKHLKNTLFKPEDTEDPADDGEDGAVEQINMSDEEKELDELETWIHDLEDQEARSVKRKKKKANKERTKLQEKLNLKMIHKGDDGPIEEDTQEPLFNLNQIKTGKALSNLDDQTPDVLADSYDESSDEETNYFRSSYVPYQKEKGKLHESGRYYVGSDEDEEQNESDSGDSSKDEFALDTDSDEGGVDNKPAPLKKKVRFATGETDDKDYSVENSVASSDEEAAEQNVENEASGDDFDVDNVDVETHPLLVDLDTRDSQTRRIQKAQLWFEKDAFKHLQNEEDEEFELEQMAESLTKKGGQIIGRTTSAKHLQNGKADTESETSTKNVTIKKENYSDCSSGDDSESGSDYEFDPPSMKKQKQSDDFEIVSKEKRKKIKLNERELALGSLIVTSKKKERDLMDEGWNRYAFNDDHLPDWFVEDEQKHMKKEAPVPETLLDEYKKKFEEFNSRPIKKVIEAKARKKKRMQKRMERAKKKLEGMMDNPDISEKEKARQIRKLYKKEPKKEVTYIVAKKHTAGKRMRRPPGVKGRFKVVDPRLKKDMRAARIKETKTKKGKNRRR